MNQSKYFKPISHKITILESHRRVWKIISNPSNLELCHPFCESNPVEKWDGSNSIDYVNYYNGVKFKRLFINWTDGLGYELLIGNINGDKSKVIWKVNNIDATSSELIISIYPHRNVHFPNFLKPIVYLVYVRPMLSKYLSSVLLGFKYYIEKDKPVQRNQFGSHKWFSN